MFNSLVKISLLLIGIFQVVEAAPKVTKSVYEIAISNPLRPAADVELDKVRKPRSILPFSQVDRGDIVLELGAGSGYTTELLSHIVGKSGKVYAHRLYNKKRLADNRLSNIVSLRDHTLFDLDKVLTENKVKKGELDAVIIFFILHDIYLNKEINEKVFATLQSWLKPDGVVVVLDNAADNDAGLSKTESLHRIGRKFVIDEFKKAGFVVDGSTDVLENEEDDHTKPWGEFKGLQDRFALRFKKSEE